MEETREGRRGVDTGTGEAGLRKWPAGEQRKIEDRLGVEEERNGLEVEKRRIKMVYMCKINRLLGSISSSNKWCRQQETIVAPVLSVRIQSVWTRIRNFERNRIFRIRQMIHFLKMYVSLL